MITIKQYNEDQGYLALDDTHRLLAILNDLENGDWQATTDLAEFLAERGYDENPAYKCACRQCDCPNLDDYVNGEIDTNGTCESCFETHTDIKESE